MKLPPSSSKKFQELLDYLCLLRFKTSKPSKLSRAYLTLKKVSEIVGYDQSTLCRLYKYQLSQQSVKEDQVLERKGIEGYISRKRPDRRKKVTLALKKLASSERTLKVMVGMSL